MFKLMSTMMIERAVTKCPETTTEFAHPLSKPCRRPACRSVLVTATPLLFKTW